MLSGRKVLSSRKELSGREELSGEGLLRSTPGREGSEEGQLYSGHSDRIEKQKARKGRRRAFL